MQRTIDEQVFRDSKRTTFDVSAPDNTPTGIPTKQIPMNEYPRVVYKHPREPFRTILHRNNKHEVVQEEVVATEHLSKLVQDEKELGKALKEGWRKEPYIPQAPADPIDNIYDSPAK